MLIAYNPVQFIYFAKVKYKMVNWQGSLEETKRLIERNV